MSGDLSTVGHCLELTNTVQVFHDRCEHKKRFSSRIVVQKWSFAIPRQQEKPQKFRTISYLPNWHGINMKSYHSTDLCVVSEFLASLAPAFNT